LRSALLVVVGKCWNVVCLQVGLYADQAQRVAVVAVLQGRIGGDLDDQPRPHLHQRP
jgi:hypothetical protein